MLRKTILTMRETRPMTTLMRQMTTRKVWSDRLMRCCKLSPRFNHQAEVNKLLSGLRIKEHKVAELHLVSLKKKKKKKYRE